MRKWRGFADNEASPVVIISSETLQITKSALPILGKPWSGRAVFFPVAPRGALFGICVLLGRGCIAFHPCLLSAVTP